ncbi:MAG: CPP1-like family protein [Synechococcus sp.]
MASGVDSGSEPDSQDPYAQLGITAESSFDTVQQAKAAALEAAGEDPQARAKVEAAYDAVLMARLRERQTGKISVAAASASEREQQMASPTLPLNNSSGVLTRLRQFSLPTPSVNGGSWAPSLVLVEGQGFLVRAVAGGFGLLLLLASAGAADLVLSLATIGVFLSQVKRGRRPLASLGWSVMLLAVGLALGALLVAVAGSAVVPVFSADQLQALPAGLLLLAGALLLA